MLLSEELIKIGKESNPKSNLSMAESSKKMFSLLQEKQFDYNRKNLIAITKNVCNTLNSEGWNYFKIEIFFG